MIRKICTLLFFLSCLLANPAWAQQSDDADAAHTFNLPKGAMIPVMLQEEIDTDYAAVGQPFSAIVSQDIYIGTTRVLSRADRVFGHVTRVEPPIEGRHAVLAVAFDYLQLEPGIKLPLNATAKNEDGEPMWGGQITPGTVPEIVPYRVWRIGSYGRVMYRGPREMGHHVRLRPGTRILVILSDPLDLFII